MPHLSRRRLVTCAAALAANVPLRAIAQTGAAPDPDLLAAVRDHLGYSVGFRRKFGTGTYSAPGRAIPPSLAAMTVRSITHRLAQISDSQPTFALLHWRGPDGRLRGWLIDGTGVIASGASAGPYDSLAFLLNALRVGGRGE